MERHVTRTVMRTGATSQRQPARSPPQVASRKTPGKGGVRGWTHGAVGKPSGRRGVCVSWPVAGYFPDSPVCCAQCTSSFLPLMPKRSLPWPPSLPPEAFRDHPRQSGMSSHHTHVTAPPATPGLSGSPGAWGRQSTCPSHLTHRKRSTE